MAAHSSILAWRIPMDRGAWRATVHGVLKSRTEQLSTAQVRGSSLRSHRKVNHSLTGALSELTYKKHNVVTQQVLIKLFLLFLLLPLLGHAVL